MFFSLLPLALMMSFEIGPTLGAFVPVQDEGDPWRTSFVLGLKARYGLSALDVESELLFTELGIDPDSSRGYTYSLVPITLGVSRNIGCLRFGAGGSLYSIEAKKELAEGLEAVWSGTYPGAYLSIGKDFTACSNRFDVTSRFNIIDFNGLWVGITASYLF